MKFNRKNLWTGYLLRSFLFVFLLLGGLSFGLFGLGIGSAKAEVEVVSNARVSVPSGASAKYTTIGCSGEPGLLLFINLTNYFGTNLSYAKFNDVDFTNISDFVSAGNLGFAFRYMLNYPIGEYNYEYSYPDSNQGGQIIELCGVDLDNPFEKVIDNSFAGWSVPHTYYATSSQESFKWITLAGATGGVSSVSSTTQEYDYDIFFGESDSDDQDIVINWNNAGSVLGYKIVIFNTGEEPETPIVNYYTDVITPTPQINYRPMLEDTYQIFRYSYNTSRIPNNIFGGLAKIEAELCLNVGCSSTTPITFDNGIATSSISYMFTGTGEISTTTSQYGSSFFTIETPTNRIGTTTATQERYKITPYYFKADTLETIRANPVVFVVNYAPEILKNPTPKAATSSFFTIFGATPHDLACSQEEWDSMTATDTPWYIKLKCPTFEKGLIFIEYAINIPAAIVNGTIETIGNIFPFGLITEIIQQWELAKNETMPEDLLWLSPVNENGDLTIDVPGTWTNSTTTQKVAIFGDTLFKSTYPTLTTFFEGIRSLSTYGIWFGLIMLMWVRGKDSYNEIMADKTEKKHEDINWQY